MGKNIRKVLKKFTLKRKIAVLIAVIILVFLGWLIFKGGREKIRYQTAGVERGTLISSISVSGQVSSTSSQAITTFATGIVKNIFVENGDYVSQGQSIAEITLDYDAEQRQAKAWADFLSAKNAVASANTALYTLQSKMFAANQKFVNDRGVTNPSVDQKADPVYIEENADWLAAEANYKNQQDVIAQANAAMNSSYLSYLQNQANILAPVSGTIIDLAVDIGAAIVGQSNTNSSSQGANPITSSQKIAAIKNNGTPTVTVSLSEIDIPKIKLGNKATLTLDAFPGKTLTGRIAGINTAGVVSSGVTNYPIIIVLDTEASEIFSNMSVSANIVIATKSDVLIVPSAAVQIQEDQSYVKILKNGIVREIPVETGISSDTEMEITSGLKEGDAVIIGTLTRQNNTGQNPSPFGAGVLRPGGFGQGTMRRQN